MENKEVCVSSPPSFSLWMVTVRLSVRQPMRRRQLHPPLHRRKKNLDLYSYIFFFFSFFISSPLCHSDLDYSSTSQHLTEEFIQKPSASGAIKKQNKTKTDIQSALVHCMCLKSNRKKSGLLSFSHKIKKKQTVSLLWDEV